MNFKQLTSVVAAGVVAASMVMPSATIAAGFTPEYVAAHEWATTNEIIKKTSIEQAEMTTSTTKAMMAKMLVNFAEKYGFVDANSKIAQAADCKNFADIDYLKNQDLHEYVIRACEYGIMWRDSASNGVAKNFAPQQKVSRAIFATALDRVLSKDLNNGKGNDWYTAHLNALNKLWIMKDTNNAGRDVIKGDVLLMLHRSVTNLAEKMKETSECTKLEQVVCMLGGDCSEACSKIVDVDEKKNDTDTTTDDKVKSGKLVVTNEKNEGGVVISKGYTSDLDTITLSSDEEVTVDSITFERMWLSNANAIDSIRLETEEGKEVTSKKSVNSKDTVSLSINKDYRTVKGTTNFVVVVKTYNTGSQDLWTNIGFKVTDIQSSAKTVKNNAEKVNLYSFIDYTANGITIENKGSSTEKTYDYAEGEMYEVAKMKITSKDVAVKVEGFTLTNNSWVDLDDIDEVEVLVDGAAIKGVKSSVKKDDLTISFPEQEIALKSNSIFTVRVSLKNFEDFGQSIKFSAKTSDIIASEVKNNVRVKINEGTEEDIKFSLYTFRGNKIEFTNTKLSSTIDIAQSWEGVIAKGTVKVNGQSVKTTPSTVTLKFGNYTGDDLKDIVDYIELSVNGVSETEIAWKSFTKSVEHTFTGSLKSFVIDEDSDIELIVHLDTKAPQNDTITVEIGGSAIINTSTLGLKYDDVKGEKDANALGSITINSVKIQSAKASLTNDVSKKVEFNTKKTEEKTVFEGTYTAKKQNVKLNEVGITRTFNGELTGSDVEFNIYVNNKNVASISDKNFKNISGTQSETFSDVVVEAWQTATIKVIAKVYANTGSDKLSYSIQFSGEDLNNNPVATSPIAMADIQFVDSSSVTTTSNAATKQKDVILADKNQEVAHFIVKPANKAEKANISSVNISWSIAFKETANKNVEDYFEIRIGGTDYADEFDFEGTNTTFANGWVISTNDLDIDITGETEVIVKAKAELSGTGANVNVAINGTKYESTRKVVPAIVRIIAQESVSDKTYTKYTFDVDFAGDYNTISGLNLIFSGTTNWSWDTIAENDTKSIKNDKESKELTKISYDVVGYTGFIEIEKGAYPDFFEIKGTPIVSFANN